MQTYPHAQPSIRFLSVRPEVCPWVSKFPTSGFLQICSHLQHPCLRLYPSRYRVDLGLAPLRNVRRQAHTEKKAQPLHVLRLSFGERNRKDCILQGIRILKITEEKHIFSQNEIRRMEAILYAFALKYFRGINLAAIKEEIAMTELGQMIWDDAQTQASERYSKLILILDKEKKNDLIIKVASDPDFREELYRKYGI